LCSRYLEIFPNPASLTQRYASQDPKLILAIPASLSHGPSRVIFADFAQMENNVVLLTGRGEEGTLGRKLFEKWNSSQREEYKWDRGKIGNNIMMDGVMHLKVCVLSIKIALQHILMSCGR
jgi:cleavage and polyadenylation specificity factor subunit 2